MVISSLIIQQLKNLNRDLPSPRENLSLIFKRRARYQTPAASPDAFASPPDACDSVNGDGRLCLRPMPLPIRSATPVSPPDTSASARRLYLSVWRRLCLSPTALSPATPPPLPLDYLVPPDGLPQPDTSARPTVCLTQRSPTPPDCVSARFRRPGLSCSLPPDCVSARFRRPGLSCSPSALPGVCPGCCRSLFCLSHRLVPMAASSSSTVNQTEIRGVRSENVPMQVINLRLTNENYFSWSPAMTMGIAARDRMTYIDGSNPEPAITSGVWRTGFLEDNQVKTWIVNSVSPEIQPLILRKKTARDMWVVLEQMYGQKKTAIHTYQVMKTVYTLRQGNSSVAEYYGALKAKQEGYQRTASYWEDVYA
ncbi:hypothetical protein EJ110_NYTH49670 [Nymphaea thermarum]|nr:hypothetical protein EJ110_NYTH49670 [Nymphaea thermarum]